MEKRNERTALLAVMLAVICLVVDLAIARVTQLRVVLALLPYPAIAFIIGLVVWFRERLARRAADEKRDAALAAKERISGSFFDQENAPEPFSLSHSRRQIERFAIPLVAPLLALGLGWWVLNLRAQLRFPAPEPGQLLSAIAFLAGQAFATFLLSRYLLGLSRNSDSRLLRGPGVALGVTCITTLIALIATLAVQSGYAPADKIGPTLLTILLAIFALENAVNFLANLYRPRHREADPCRSYESRLGGLLAEPGAWARNVAGALDYQFGFKVSDTWLYRFLENALLPLVIFQIIALYLLSCLVFLAPDEEGILERFGKPIPNAWHLDSGLHLKLPWPFETVQRFPAKRVLSFRIGQGETPNPGPDPSVITWSVPHAQNEEQFLTPSPVNDTNSAPVNLVAFNIPVEYQITNIYQFAYQHADAPRLVQQIAYRSLTQEIASRDLFLLMGDGQSRIARSLWDSIQSEVDRRQLGVKILYVGLQGIHPPTQVAGSFESVVGAVEQKEAAILIAHTSANHTNTLARADAAKALLDAAAYKTERTVISEAEAKRFLIQEQTAARSPRVFRNNLYLTTLEETLTDVRKYIVPASASNEVIQMNFEDKIPLGMFGNGLDAERK